MTVYIDRARGRRLGAKSNRYARTQKSSNSLIRFRCSNSCFLLESDIAGHERLFLAKWHPKAEKKLRKRRFFDTADRHEKLYGRSRLYASAQGRHETSGVLSLFSRLSSDISIKNSVQRWSSDFQGLFRVKIRKMAQGSDDLSTLPLNQEDDEKKKKKPNNDEQVQFWSTVKIQDSKLGSKLVHVAYRISKSGKNTPLPLSQD